MRDKIKNSADEAVAMIPDGAVVMVGGFMNCSCHLCVIFYAFCVPDFFRKYRAKKASEKPMSISDTATHN